jgi:hypothetical protein
MAILLSAVSAVSLLSKRTESEEARSSSPMAWTAEVCEGATASFRGVSPLIKIEEATRVEARVLDAISMSKTRFVHRGVQGS